MKEHKTNLRGNEAKKNFGEKDWKKRQQTGYTTSNKQRQTGYDENRVPVAWGEGRGGGRRTGMDRRIAGSRSI